ncbi:hypothetical protein BDF19DRAFT_454610 [Syncephalis fuscata]|nr:hypothetical protein BDF19DRAFT_454610 [Syncephalis fuscata]
MLAKTLLRATKLPARRIVAASTYGQLQRQSCSPGLVSSLSFSTSSRRADSSSNSDDATDATQKSAASRAAGKASQLVSSLLHGSKAAKGPGDHEDVSETFSKVLARGKYVHELQRHKIKPECVDDYAALVAEHFPYIASGDQQDVKLCGSWMTQIGDQDEAMHIWEYTGYTGHDTATRRLQQDPKHAAFLRKLSPMLRSRSNQICLEFAFWATMAPSFHGGVYELRSYRLKPGNLLEWETNWRRGLECRRQFCEPIGAWFSQLGQLNYVHHMWQYPDLESRKRTREQAWSVNGWAETVYNTVRLIDEMNAVILTPLPFSPLK